MQPSLIKKIKTISQAPGVYQMLDANSTVLYVGKARNLRQRLLSYTRKTIDSAKTASLVERISDIKVIITASENEALLLESNLIKQYRPRYNVLMRDDKSYPYLFLSAHQFPRLAFHRGAKRAKGHYFGPYPNPYAVRESLALIQKLFKLRQCSDTFFANRSRPCLQYQIKRCTAPCVNYVTAEEYDRQVQLALLFLAGKSNQIVEQLDQAMQVAAKSRDYERAAQLRDQIKLLRSVQSQQYMIKDAGDIDIISVAQQMGHTAITIIFVRGGRVIGHRTFFPKTPSEIDSQRVLQEFIPQYYLSPLRGEHAVQKIVLDERLDDKAWLEGALTEQLDVDFKIIDHSHAKYKQWQRLARTNAEHALAQRVLRQENASKKLILLQTALDLPNPISRMECFDISHSQGESTIASCVVFAEDGPVKQDYRRFNINNIQAGDDYAAMEQALTRRYKRLKAEAKAMPDLLVIDGGKGQHNKALSVLEELQVTGVVVLSIAKGPSRKPGEEQLFLGGKAKLLQLPSSSPALHMLQWIRDEAHRFAITSHRNQRDNKRSQSVLETIPGVGAKRRQALLHFFGGWQQLQQAAITEIAKVPGISEKLAAEIYAQLHPE